MRSATARAHPRAVDDGPRAARLALAALLSISALGLTGCPAEEAAEAPSPAGPATPAALPEAAVAEPAPPPRRPKIDHEPEAPPPEPLPGGDCPLPPSWRVLEPCFEDGYAYAKGEAPLGLNPSLSRSQAALRARWALLMALGRIEDGVAEVRGAEVPEMYVCEGTAYALARLALRKAPRLPGCGTTLSSRAVAPEGCPEWTRGVAWLEGEDIVGVAIVDGVRNPALARSSALRRAKGAAAEVVQVRLSQGGEGVNAFTPTMLLTTKDSEVAECEGQVWGKVRVDKTAR